MNSSVSLLYFLQVGNFCEWVKFKYEAACSVSKHETEVPARVFFVCVCFVVVAVLFFACLFFKYYREKRQEKCLKNVIKHFYSNNDILCGSNHVFCCALFWLPAMTSFQFPNSAFLKTNGP